MEASEKIEEGDRFIAVNIYEKLGLGYIEISNRFDGSITYDKSGRPLTSKKQEKSRHGLGYLSMKMVIEKYNGFLSSNDENNIYTLTIAFPLS